MARQFEFEIPETDRNVIRTELKRAFSANSIIVSLGVFSFVFSVKFGISNNVIQLLTDGFLNTSDLFGKFNEILYRRMHEVVLFVTVLAWYFLYRSAAYSEIELLARLHSKARLPEKFEEFSKFSTVVFLSAGLTIAFALMAFFVNYFPLYCIFLFLASIQDIYGNRTIITQLRLLQKKRNEDIPESDKKRDVIIRLREVCYDYWTYNPQIERIMLFFTLNIAALLFYLFVGGVAYADLLAPKPYATVEEWMWFILRFRNPELAGYDIWIVLAYGVSVFSILLNERTMSKWRKKRNIALRQIFADEIELEKKLAAGEG